MLMNNLGLAHVTKIRPTKNNAITHLCADSGADSETYSGTGLVGNGGVGMGAGGMTGAGVGSHPFPQSRAGYPSSCGVNDVGAGAGVPPPALLTAATDGYTIPLNPRGSFGSRLGSAEPVLHAARTKTTPRRTITP